MDVNSATGPLLGAALAFAIFSTKEEGYPLETSTDDTSTDDTSTDDTSTDDTSTDDTSTDDRCFISPVITDGLVTRRLARSYRHLTTPRFRVVWIIR